ncbi:hypothetical protein BpHYR1_002924 [Brachionus plicatilis]|uniref:Uncharacterized protein n=1 Tax=Brachionus plicatilis TaxID=10195 RepID=A0A3M7P9A1_BRAPC|nr:hypothetical protein BpHYR1_002924 [Brachionus plicatilis]
MTDILLHPIFDVILAVLWFKSKYLKYLKKLKLFHDFIKIHITSIFKTVKLNMWQTTCVILEFCCKI